MAWSVEDIANYFVAEYGERVAAGILHDWMVCRHKAAMQKVETPQWWEASGKRLLGAYTWTVKVIGGEGIDLSAVDDLLFKKGSPEWKHIQRRAVNLEPADFVGEVHSRVHSELRMVVTAGRQKVLSGGVSKAEKSMSNKLANALLRLVGTVDKMRDDLTARSKTTENAD